MHEFELPRGCGLVLGAPLSLEIGISGFWETGEQILRLGFEIQKFPQLLPRVPAALDHSPQRVLAMPLGQPRRLTPESVGHRLLGIE